VIDDAPVHEVVRRLVAGGVPIHRVEPLEPTLEDLYVSLHSRARPGPADLGGPSVPQAEEIAS